MAAPAAGRAPRILGLTGAIACGKTTVGDILLECGAVERIDADQVVHALMQANTEVTRDVAAAFGEGVLNPDGSVDRRRLGNIVFEDASRLRELEAIVHPAVRKRIRERLSALRGRDGVVVVDAVRLLQSDLLPLCDAVWVVRCDGGSQRKRLTDSRGMSAAQARARLSAQPSFEHPSVTTVIENSGSLDNLRRQVEAAWHRQLERWDLESCTLPSE